MREHPAAAGRREPDDEVAGREGIEMRAEGIQVGNGIHATGPTPQISLALLAP